MNRKQLLVMGLALGLPSTLIGLFMLLSFLESKGYISFTVMLIVIVTVTIYTLVLMLNYARKKKN